MFFKVYFVLEQTTFHSHYIWHVVNTVREIVTAYCDSNTKDLNTRCCKGLREFAEE